MTRSRPVHDAVASQHLAAEIQRLLQLDDTPGVVRRLGGHGHGMKGTFGFWVPQLADETAAVDLELLTADATLDPGRDEAHEVTFKRISFPMTVVGQFAWTVVDGLAPGDRDTVGPLYQAIVHGRGGRTDRLIDPLAFSTPFGAFAPSELVDTAGLFGRRADSAYYQSIATDRDEPPRLGPFVNLLQVHVPTATASGTLAGLTQRLSEVAEKVVAGEPLAPADELWLGYDAIQLMPVEPTIRREAGPHAWTVVDETSSTVRVRVQRPTTTNWGYDVIIGGGAAVNPALLESGRPHELSDLSTALHGFPTGPMKLVLDVVYGHADNQAVGIMPNAWFTGPDMYGQHLDYSNPVVRAHLLEMQRRKADHGADGIRVDGSQDFTVWDAENEVVRHDDAFLHEMSQVVQRVGGVSYRPWMVFEDGRPWPRSDWELASTYREVTTQQPHAFQWGPLTFAHNTPFLVTFWVNKWWRLREITEVGDTWISGCANHDTLRRGSQVDPHSRINAYLGDTLPAIIRRAYDHPASTLLFHAFLPGVPMDFLQSIAQTPWSFIRNTDHQYAIKVWAEEARFLDWRVPAEVYDDPTVFPRMKDLGFHDVAALQAFMAHLHAAVAIHGDAIDPVVAATSLAPRPSGLPATAEALIDAAHRWMDDVHDLCCVERHIGGLDPALVRFDHAVRAFRQEHEWLRSNLDDTDRFAHLHPTDGTVLFHGLRRGPAGEQVLFVANMEGAARSLRPLDLADDDGRWQLALASPGAALDSQGTVLLRDGEGLVFVHPRPD